ncbi:helix-turn-helix transcriptional regulator [Chryseobacterium sp. RG1]|uniref:Helix-turn-helix transcriptional regulator n=1 Tax=Chryseobacterium tagetis TaxID=2801334 RepID=A0ABS8A4E1_9FLAO|nr:helix-turn-helix transcriptional regulator [Chryseobacterium tagetis]MCA6068313.1 helix-turn-helix transcriptional regulator [Chryseobacterium tagetis]
MEKNASQDHVLQKVWNGYSDFFNNKKQILASPPIEKLIADMFSVGRFYYYVLNITDSTLTNHHENILAMHGLKKYPLHLKEVLDLVHPDDMDFVMEAERMCLEKMLEIDGFAYQQELKSSYCFRMKTEKGNYEMFHHQAIHTLKDKEGKLLQAVNIHTNISHFTQENSYTVLISGIGNRKDFHQMHYQKGKILPQNKLTKREVEVLGYIAKGYSASQISKVLNISFYTARTHRKNILQKTESKNLLELVKKCFLWGYL